MAWRYDASAASGRRSRSWAAPLKSAARYAVAGSVVALTHALQVDQTVLFVPAQRLHPSEVQPGHEHRVVALQGFAQPPGGVVEQARALQHASRAVRLYRMDAGPCFRRGRSE